MPVASSELTLTNPFGLHARPSARVVQVAQAHASQISLQTARRKANAKDLMQLLMLAAGPGTVVTVTAEGEDAEAALQAVCAELNRAE